MRKPEQRAEGGRVRAISLSRQLPPAAQPNALLGFQLRHLEQSHQHAEPVAPRQPGQFGNGFSDEARGFIRPAISRRII